MIFWRNLRPADLAKVIEAIGSRALKAAQTKTAAARPSPQAAPATTGATLRVIQGR